MSDTSQDRPCDKPCVEEIVEFLESTRPPMPELVEYFMFFGIRCKQCLHFLSKADYIVLRGFFVGSLQLTFQQFWAVRDRLCRL